MWVLFTFDVSFVLFPIWKNQSLHSCRIGPFPCWHQPIFPPFVWGPCGTPWQCAFHAPCIHVLCLRAELCSLFCFVVWDHWDRSRLWLLSLPAFHVLFVPVQAESTIQPFDGSFVIVFYQEQITLLVCAFTLPGYWSYKLIKLIPVLISVAVYILQPKLLSFSHSFSSISQPVLSPLQQLHLYNSQYSRNDLPEQPFLILPPVQTLF